MDPRNQGKRTTSGSVKAVGVPRPAPPPSFWRRNAKRILAAALGLLFLHDLFGAHGLIALRRTQKEMAGLRQELQKLDEENRGLSGQVKGLKSDPRMIERIAREEMGLAKPGEKVFKLPAPSNPQAPK